MSENKKKSEKKDLKSDSLLNYFPGDAYDPEFFKKVGLMDEKETISFKRAYFSENNVNAPSPDSQFPISVQNLPKMREGWPKYKDQLDFLCSAALPLQMKKLEMGLPFIAKDSQNFPFENVLKQTKLPKFIRKMDFRWQLYLSVVLGTVNDLNSKISIEECRKDPELIPTFLENRKRAYSLETELRHSLKDLGEYFLSQETIWSMQNNENEKVKTAFSNISKLFDNSVKMMSKPEVLGKEKDILNLFAKAVVWNTSNTTESKTALFDWTYDWANELDKMKLDEELSEVRKELGMPIESRKTKRLNKKYKWESLIENKAYNYVDGMGVYFDLFYRLGLINEKGFTLAAVAWNILLQEMEMRKKGKNAAEKAKKSKFFEDSEREPEEKELTDEEKARKVENEGEALYVSLYKRIYNPILKRMGKKLQNKDFSNNFDLGACLYILRKTAPLLLLKATQVDDVIFDGDTASDVRSDKIKFPRSVDQYDDFEKTCYLTSMINATVQDLRETQIDHCVRDANITQERLEDILEGLPEYWFCSFVEDFNYHFAKNNTPAKEHSVQVLLDEMASCFDLKTSEGISVTTDEVPYRLSELKNLANMAVSLNPKWNMTEKDEFLDDICQMNIPERPRFIISSNTPNSNDEKGPKTHE